jgi:hypothetical protein
MMFRRGAGGRYTLNIQNVEKKLREAKFFLNKMREYERGAFQDPEPFDFYLSAFLNAGMTVRNGFHVTQNRKRDAAIKHWRKQWETSHLSPKARAIYDFMREDRRVEVHGSGSRRRVKTKDQELVQGTNRFASGTDFVSGPASDVLPLGSRPAPAYSFTIAGTERTATDACAEYLTLLERMVERFKAEHP